MTPFDLGNAQLSDHVVSGRGIFPAAGYMEMCHSSLAALTDTLLSPKVLVSMTIPSPYLLGQDSTSRLAVKFDLSSSAFSVMSAGVSGRPGTHFCGSFGSIDIAASAYASPTVSSRAACRYAVESVALYGALHAAGLQYGRRFQNLRCSHTDGNVASGNVESRHTDGYHIHPAVLDSCLHLSAASAIVKLHSQPEGASAPATTRVPASIDAFVLTHRVRDALVDASSVLHDDDSSRSSYSLCTVAGETIADLCGLQTKEMGAVSTKALRTASADAHASMYASEWHAIEGVPRSGDVLAHRPDVPAGPQLRVDGARVTTDNRSLSGDWSRSTLVQTQIAMAASLLQPSSFVVFTSEDVSSRSAYGSADVPAFVSTRAAGGLLRAVSNENASMSSSSAVVNLSPYSACTYDAGADSDVYGQQVRGGYLCSPRLLECTRQHGALPFKLTTSERGSLSNLLPHDAELNVGSPGVLVARIQAVGLNFRDVLNVLGMYPGDPGDPGADCSGFVSTSAFGTSTDVHCIGSAIYGLAPGCLGTHVQTLDEVMFSKPPSLSYAEAATCPTGS